MKKIINTLTTLFLLLPLMAYAEEEIRASDMAISVGVLNGGGALIGVDMEKLVTDRIGLSVGAGLVAFGAGLNIHFSPTVSSSSIRIGFNNQGTTGENVMMRSVGVSYLGRSSTGKFEWQLGLAHPFNVNQKVKDAFGGEDPPPVILTYSIGAYFAL